MMFVSISSRLLLAASDDAGGGIRALEWDLPTASWGWCLLIVGVGLAILWVLRVYRRDTAEQPVWVKILLPTLRLTVVAALLLIALNPQERTQRMAYRPSRVAILVDRSLSMRFPSKSPSDGRDATAASAESRAKTVESLMAESDLIPTLRRHHEVSVYSFESRLAGPHHVFSKIDGSTRPAEASDSKIKEASGATDSLDWEELLRPRGAETRLGESLLELIRHVSGRTLSGIVVVTDGASNAGIEPETVNAIARAQKIRLITVGVGSTQRPINLQISKLQAPTDVHIDDPFTISAFVQGEGLEQQQVSVELLTKSEGEGETETLIATQTPTLLEDGVPVEVTFEYQPPTAGTFEFTVRAATGANVRELSDEDNERRKTITVIDRRMRVLLIAGGPSRDYRFARNMLYRHNAVQLDVWLQTADANTAISQEADRRLVAFPSTRADVFGYDVIVAFDPDWTQVPEEGMQSIQDWIFSQAGGLIFVAGDINTPRLATAEDMAILRELCPVVLDPLPVDFQFDRKASQPWPLSFTREGTEAGFLQLTDDPATAASAWTQFGGVYRCYPTRGSKAGAIVFARFSDPRSQTEHGAPILLASQFYGAGRILYMGTAEWWRLRALDEAYYDRFWTKAIREVGQARLSRGASRGMLLLERVQYVLGQTVRIRAQLFDSQYHPYQADSVPVEIRDPNGRPCVPPVRLLPDGNRAGQFVADYRVALPGTYRVELPIPESTERDVKWLDVILSNLESSDPRQNAQLLRELVRDTGGVYVNADEAGTEISDRLPKRDETYLVDEQLRTLWDRQWVMYLVIGLLSFEWLIRKLLKLA